jgi:DNA-binding Xre family transcriptional regulator
MGKRSLVASITGIKVAKLKLEGRNLSQKALGEELGISWSTISKFFDGKPVDRPIFVEICEFLSLEWEDVALFPERSGEAGEEHPRPAPEPPVSEALLQADRPIERFGALIADKTEGFVGREYVFEAISEFLTVHPKGYFILQADPGMGKSAILARYVQRYPCLAYFNVRAQGINRAGQFLESICTQLIRRYDLPYPVLPQGATSDGDFFARLLVEASGRLENGEKLAIVIDALDEVDTAGQDPGANLLYLPAHLPGGVYLILSQRPITLPLTIHAPEYRFDLKQYERESSQDVRDYLHGATEREKLRDWIEGKRLSIEEFVSRLAHLSENNFMYLRYVLPQIEAGFYRDFKIDGLPKGLEGYYEDHWRRMGMNVKPIPHLKLKIIYILGEIRQPVSRQLLAEYAREGQLTVQEVLDDWEQFLHEREIEEQNCYSIYHTSFLDFLHRKDIVRAAGIDLVKINTLIADRLWAGLFDDD